MKNQALPELIAQGQEILSAIRQHPDYQTLDYHPDLSIGDAVQALNELSFEVLSSPQPIKIFSLPGFSQ
jgi:hypothetical protein